ncbi:CAP domain-containing protein [Ruminococcus flavefaciens]|uniref:Cysteine-rich secretory protein family protein n=1 Tax=Ruminococcus flavefaciens TaxID=1265 RepID=A0A1M7GP90_RUMFL|nr:CAP domain-containing protein [Ruminococcus flavefaciens]SHM17699.1 Cysteine-rich secretory protein family protein [Ruminococcus flavefaciens]
MRKIRNTSSKAMAAFLSVLMALSFLTYRPRVAHAVEDTDLKVMADEIVILVNEARADAGLKPLRAVPYLNDKARERARELIFDFSHYRPGRRIFYLTNECEFTLEDVSEELTESIAKQLDEKWCFATWSEDKKSFRVDVKKKDDVESVLICENVSFSSFETTEGLAEKISGKQFFETWSEDNKSFSVDKKYESAVNKFLQEEKIKYTMGDLFITIIDAGLVPYARAGENTAGGSDNAKATFNQWKGSPVHWKAIMNPDYTHIGVGVAYEKDSTFRYYWDQIFIGTTKELDGQYIPESTKTVPVGSGDLNGDKEISSFDLITINKFLAKEIEFNELQMQSADLLQDGIITAADAVVLRKYILGRFHTIPVTMEMFLNG